MAVITIVMIGSDKCCWFCLIFNCVQSNCQQKKQTNNIWAWEHRYNSYNTIVSAICCWGDILKQIVLVTWKVQDYSRRTVQSWSLNWIFCQLWWPKPWNHYVVLRIELLSRRNVIVYLLLLDSMNIIPKVWRITHCYWL